MDLKEAWNKMAGRLETLIGHALIAAAARVGVGAVFFLSGRTKVDGFLTVNESAITLFREEYKVPLLPPEFAAHMAAYAEHLLPLLLFLGLATRLSALGLLGMTAVIQVFDGPALGAACSAPLTAQPCMIASNALSKRIA